MCLDSWAMNQRQENWKQYSRDQTRGKVTRHPGSARQIIVLDNCALNDILVCNPSGHLADDIRIAVLKEQMAVWTSPYLITETIAGSETDRLTARKKLAFLQVVSGGRMLKYPRRLLEWEGLNGRSPSDEDRFMPHDEEKGIYEWSFAVCEAGGIVLDPEDGSELSFKELVYRDKIAAQRAASEAAEAAHKAVVHAFAAYSGRSEAGPDEMQYKAGARGGVDFPALGKWMRSISRTDFAGWVSRTLEQLGYKRTISGDDLPLFPHATSAAGYFLTEIAGNYETGKKWKRNDTYDLQYCVAASQAGTLVTLDIDLQAQCAQMPHKSFRTSGIRELADLLAQSSQ